MLICGILTVFLGSYYGVFIALFLPKYLTLHLNYSVLLVNKVMIASSIIGISVIILSSWLSDYINIYKLYALSSILLIIFSYKIFYYINSHNTLYMISAVYLLSFIVAIATGLVCRIICGLFSTEIRLTGVAICYNIAFALIGGTIPISTEILINKLNLIMAPTLISIIVGLLCLGAITIIKNHKGIDHQ
jgi:hypothetical protein